MAKINIRSPYHIYTTQANLTSALLELYIYTGTQTTSRGAVKYSLNSTAYNNEVTFEISELVRDYLDVTFNGSYTSQMVWVDYQITKSISGSPIAASALVALSGFDGYGYFNEGVNPQNVSTALISNSIIYKLDDDPLRLPVEADGTKTVTFYNGNDSIYSQSITSSLVSSSRIVYATNAIGTESDYKSAVINDGGTFEGSSCLTSFLNSLSLYPVDKVTIESDIYTVVNIQECNHTPYKITFINKFGAKQDLYFFKRSNKTITTKKESYKGNILSSGIYSISEHQNKTLNKQGAEKLTLNSGFVDEELNEVFTQLLLSEKVWILYDEQTLPIDITNSSFSYKTQLNDRLINYTIDLDFSFDKINSVR